MMRHGISSDTQQQSIAYLQSKAKRLYHESSVLSDPRCTHFVHVVHHAVVQPAQLAQTQGGVAHGAVELQRRVDDVALRSGVVSDVLATHALRRMR